MTRSVTLARPGERQVVSNVVKVLVAGLALGGMVAFYTYTTYLQKFMYPTSWTVQLSASRGRERL